MKITYLVQGWDRKYLKKEEGNITRERIDRASWERSDFWDFWYKKQSSVLMHSRVQFQGGGEFPWNFKILRNLMPDP